MRCATVQTDIDIHAEVFRYNPNDPESKQKLVDLLARAGFVMAESWYEELRHIIENLVWRKTASPLEDNGHITLAVFLDLGEGDLVPFATFGAGKFTSLRHAEL